MSTAGAVTLDFQSAPINPRGMPTAEIGHNHNDDKKMMEEDINVYVNPSTETGMEVMDPELIPTEEDLLTLRKVPAPLP
jgi:POT family proton-dependent oligopeptide transporter